MEDEDAVTGKYELQKSRKWLLSPHMVETEIVRTAFLAIRQAALHEVDEAFKYQGARIYGPHVSVQALVKAAKSIDVRKPPMVQSISLRSPEGHRSPR